MLLWSKAATSAKMIIEDFVSASERGGADGTVLFNAIPGARIDIERRTFVCGSTGFGGYSGSGVKPFALWRCVQAASVAKRPVIGAGGITTAEDVVEFIMAGAHLVQIGAASMSRPDYFPASSMISTRSWNASACARSKKSADVPAQRPPRRREPQPL